MARVCLRLLETYIDGRENAARNRQQMRRENDGRRIDPDLLQQFAGVAMREHAIRGEIVGRIHEMRLGGGRFARAAHAALRVGNDAVLAGRQDLRRPAASARGSPMSHSSPDWPPAARPTICAAMQLRHAINGLRLNVHRLRRAFIFEFVDGAIGRLRSAAMRRSGRSRACRAQEPQEPTRATAHAAWRGTAPRTSRSVSRSHENGCSRSLPLPLLSINSG